MVVLQTLEICFKRSSHPVIDHHSVDNVAVPEHVLLALAGEGADAAVEAIVLLVDRPRLHAARDLVPLLLPLLLVGNLQCGR